MTTLNVAVDRQKTGKLLRKPEKLPPKRAKTKLSDSGVSKLPAAAAGQGTYDQMDSVTPGFGVRIAESGRKTFILAARFPRSPNFMRRSLGREGVLTVQQARDKAKAWLDLISKGVDPKDRERQRRVEEQHKRENTFAAVGVDFIKERALGAKCYEQWETLKFRKAPAVPHSSAKGSTSPAMSGLC
jgi:hypothetical protein